MDLSGFGMYMWNKNCGSFMFKVFAEQNWIYSQSEIFTLVEHDRVNTFEDPKEITKSFVFNSLCRNKPK